jgi:hypothetical protein
MESGLNAYARNINSQYGEDGIIEEIINRLKVRSKIDKWCVEFGAWDGIHLSNTYNLISKRKYSSVLIEGDKDKYKKLCENIPSKSAHKICQFVTFDGESKLDNILKKTPIPIDFDFLSIDIDGCDYFIFESLKLYKPKIICIEYNPTIPNEVEYVQEKNFSIKQGCSAKALINLGDSKGYSLVAVTKCNVILVKSELVEYVLNNPVTLEMLRDDSSSKVFLFSSYDGSLLSNMSSVHLPWHGVKQEIQKIQILPKFLRTFYSDYSKYQLVMFYSWLLIRHTNLFMNKFQAKFIKKRR